MRPELMISTSLRFLATPSSSSAPGGKRPSVLEGVTDEQWKKAGLTADDKRELQEIDALFQQAGENPYNVAAATALHKKLDEVAHKEAQKQVLPKFREPKNVPKVSAERLKELDREYEKLGLIHPEWFLSLTPAEREKRIPRHELQNAQIKFLEVVEESGLLPQYSDIPITQGVAVPSLSKLTFADAADAWICRAAQHALFTSAQHLRADLATLRTRQGETVNIDTFLLPLPADIRPDPALRTVLTTAASDPVEEQRRHILLSGGHLDKRFKGQKSWEALKTKISEGYRLEEAAILHYYSRVGAPAEDPDKRRVTLDDIYLRRCDPLFAFDRIKWDLLDYQETRADPALLAEVEKPLVTPSVLTEQDHPSKKEFPLSSRHLQYAHWYLFEHERIQQRVKARKATLPSTEELAAMPAGLEKSLLKREKDIHKGFMYSAILSKVDEIFHYNKDRPSWVKNWLVKLAGAFGAYGDSHVKDAAALDIYGIDSKDPNVLKAWENVKQRFPVADPELQAQVDQAVRRLQSREEYDK